MAGQHCVITYTLGPGALRLYERGKRALWYTVSQITMAIAIAADCTIHKAYEFMFILIKK
jgi:hypothetical protein